MSQVFFNIFISNTKAQIVSLNRNSHHSGSKVARIRKTHTNFVLIKHNHLLKQQCIRVVETNG